MSAKELYSTYRSGRHSVEKAFGMVKGPVSIRPVFVYNCYVSELSRQKRI
jgi:hypothetical protein